MKVTRVPVDAGAHIIDFGMHSGETIAEVAATDRGYLHWVVAAGTASACLEGSKREHNGNGPSQELRVLAPVVKMFLKSRSRAEQRKN